MQGQIVFFLAFTTLYGAMHILVYVHASRALGLSLTAKKALALFFTAMTLTPAAASILGDRTGPLSWAAFVWMGLVFYLFLGTLPLALTRSFTPKAAQRALFLTMVLACLGVGAYGVYNARHIEVRRVTILTDKLPPGTDSIRIAAISDLHLYSVEEGSRLDRVLPVLESLDYDILVSLGDLIEMGVHRAYWRESSSRLAQISPRLGKYAVNGNHEAYADRVAGQNISEEFHADAGFTLLSNTAVNVGGVLWIAGAEYAGNALHAKGAAGTEADLLRSIPFGLPVVLLKHVPLVDSGDTGLVDLQLSGHTHGGQIWPFSALVRLLFPFMEGLYPLASGARLYVNTGTGTWGPPMRVGTRPEITLITLKQGDPDKMSQ